MIFLFSNLTFNAVGPLILFNLRLHPKFIYEFPTYPWWDQIDLVLGKLSIFIYLFIFRAWTMKEIYPAWLYVWPRFDPFCHSYYFKKKNSTFCEAYYYYYFFFFGYVSCNEELQDRNFGPVCNREYRVEQI